MTARAKKASGKRRLKKSTRSQGELAGKGRSAKARDNAAEDAKQPTAKKLGPIMTRLEKELTSALRARSARNRTRAKPATNDFETAPFEDVLEDWTASVLTLSDLVLGVKLLLLHVRDDGDAQASAAGILAIATDRIQTLLEKFECAGLTHGRASQVQIVVKGFPAVAGDVAEAEYEADKRKPFHTCNDAAKDVIIKQIVVKLNDFSRTFLARLDFRLAKNPFRRQSDEPDTGDAPVADDEYHSPGPQDNAGDTSGANAGNRGRFNLFARVARCNQGLSATRTILEGLAETVGHWREGGDGAIEVSTTQALMIEEICLAACEELETVSATLTADDISDALFKAMREDTSENPSEAENESLRKSATKRPKTKAPRKSKREKAVA